MDNFKKYIQENRQELDIEKPDARLWAQMQQYLPAEPSKKIVPIYRWIAAAACIVLVFVSGYFLLQKNKPQDIPTFVKKDAPIIDIPKTAILDSSKNITEQITAMPPKVQTETLASSNKTEKIQKKKEKRIAPQYVIEDVEIGNFAQIIAYQRQYINTLPIYGANTNDFKDFQQQLNQMDTDEKSVRNDIKKHGINSSQIELLINIYQQKINLLKQLNQEINRVNKSYYQNRLQHDTLKNDNPHFLNI
ncbi:MAG: hypothetical protein QM610_00760 [Chitinophagaceae bacterium]